MKREDTIKKMVKELDLNFSGNFENDFYVIHLDDSDEYSLVYSKLNKVADNTEYPSFGTNTVNTTIKVTNYFEYTFNNIKYLFFLIADFDNDKYYLKLKEA